MKTKIEIEILKILVLLHTKIFYLVFISLFKSYSSIKTC